jgi:hypothetical protein
MFCGRPSEIQEVLLPTGPQSAGHPGIRLYTKGLVSEIRKAFTAWASTAPRLKLMVRSMNAAVG